MIANPPERLTEERAYPALRTPNGGKDISGATGYPALRILFPFVTLSGRVMRRIIN